MSATGYTAVYTATVRRMERWSSRTNEDDAARLAWRRGVRGARKTAPIKGNLCVIHSFCKAFLECNYLISCQRWISGLHHS
jgi:hypothetical protein